MFSLVFVCVCVCDTHVQCIVKWLFWYDLNGDERDGNRTIDEGVVLYCLRALTGSGNVWGRDLKWQSSAPKKSWFRKPAAVPVDVVPFADAAEAARAVFECGCAATCGGAEEKMGLIDTVPLLRNDH